jgi:hypothetical protein
MKVKNFITGVALSFFLTGCQVTAVDYLSHDNGLSEYEVTLVASGVLGTYMSPDYYHTYDDGYYYDYHDTYIDSYIGDVSLVIVDNFYGYDQRNPYRGNIEIISDDMTIYLDVIDDYYVEVTLYDHYDSSYDRQFITTWAALGF